MAVTAAMAVKGAYCEPGSGGCNVTERDCSAPPAQRQHGDGDTGSSGDRQLTHQAVQDYYGRVLKSSRDLKTSACTAGGKPPALLRQVGRQTIATMADHASQALCAGSLQPMTRCAF